MDAGGPKSLELRKAHEMAMCLWNRISHVMEEENDCVSKSHSLTRKREEEKKTTENQIQWIVCYTTNQASEQKKGSFTELKFS